MEKGYFISIIFILFATTVCLQAQTQLTNLPAMFITTLENKLISYIDETDESLSSGAWLMLWAPQDDDSQLWKIEAVDNTHFRFFNKRSGLAMTADGRGNNLIQTDLNESTVLQNVPQIGIFYPIINVFFPLILHIIGQLFFKIL